MKTIVTSIFSVMFLACCALAGDATANLPFADNFEAGVLSNCWSVSSTPAGLVLEGMASLHADNLRLTETKIYPNYYSTTRGAAWHADKQQVASGFTNTFSFRIEALLGRQREGLAFVIQNDALDAWWKLASIFSGGMLGLFLLGVFSKQKNTVGAIVGVIVGLGVILWLSLSNLLLSEEALGNQFHTYLTIVFGTSAIFLVGFLFTLFKKGEKKNGRRAQIQRFS